MNKFQKTLTESSKGIKAARARLLADNAAYEQRKRVEEFEDKERQLSMELLSLTDVYPESSLSLMATKPNFNCKDWLENIHIIKTKLLDNQIDLEIARDVYDEWFAEAPKKSKAE